ncbi:MAG: diguanylate cyclase [Desulfobulbus sp.]
MTIRLKLFFSHVLAVLLVSGSIGTYFYTSAAKNLLQGLQERLQSSAALISRTIDAEDLREVRTEADVSRPEYIATLQNLRSLRRMNPDIAYMYVMRHEGEKVVFVVDSDETAEQAQPGDEYEQRLPSLIRGFSTMTVDDKLTTDRWGSFLSGYAPIKNGEGMYLVGIDMRADHVSAKQRALRISGLLSLLCSIALAFLFASYLARRFMTPIQLAIDRCTGIAAGRFNETILVRTNDELDELLDAFNTMSASLLRAEEKKQEAFDALRRVNDELEIRVRQRTADLKEVNDKLSHEIARRMAMQTALEEASTIDPLTRLLNRRAMLERLEHEAARSSRNAQPFIILMVDLDYFKGINDTWGREAGDSILVESGVRIKGMLRPQDSVACWGGEQFVILLPETTLEHGIRVAEQVRNRIAETPFYAAGEPINLTVSIGVAMFAGGPECDIQQVLTSAADALYAAKHWGRNRVESDGEPVRLLISQQQQS